MKSMLRHISLMTVFLFCLANIAWADELTEMKEQIKMMQQQLKEQSQTISVLQGEIAALKTTDRVKSEAPKEQAKSEKKDVLNCYWKDGLNFRTEDKKFDLKIGGRIFTDFMSLQEDSRMKGRIGKETNMAELRDARINIGGSIYENYIYRFEVDFAGGSSPNIKDMYAGLKNIPYIGTFRAGQYKQPISIDELTSSANMTFMEHTLPNAFIPSYRLGLQVNNTEFNERMTWAASLYTESTNDIATSNEWSLASRVTGLPWYEDDGAKLLHLGIGYTFRNPEQTLQYRQRPEAHMAPYFADTGTFNAKNSNTLAYEAAAVYGPVFLQGEFVQDYVNKTGTSGIVYFDGCYAQASYFLTGEHRQYDKSRGIFSILRPYKNFSFADRTFGAWEIAARYSNLDLKDDGIGGGSLNDATLGLNWYLNPNMRIMGNYVHSHRNGVGDADILLTRFQAEY